MKHLRAAIVVVVSIALAVGFAALGWARYGVAAGVASALGTLGVALVRGHGPRRAFGGAALAALAAVAAHAFLAFVIGAGLPVVRTFARGVVLAPVLTTLMLAWAWTDHGRR